MSGSIQKLNRGFRCIVNLHPVQVKCFDKSRLLDGYKPVGVDIKIDGSNIVIVGETERSMKDVKKKIEKHCGQIVNDVFEVDSALGQLLTKEQVRQYIDDRLGTAMKPFAWGVEVIMEMDKLMVSALTKADVSKVKMQILACVTETPMTMDVSGTVWFKTFLEKESGKVSVKNSNREGFTVYTTLDLYEKYIKPNLVTSPDPKASIGSGRKSKSTVSQSQTPGTNDKTNRSIQKLNPGFRCIVNRHPIQVKCFDKSRFLDGYKPVGVDIKIDGSDIVIVGETERSMKDAKKKIEKHCGQIVNDVFEVDSALGQLLRKEVVRQYIDDRLGTAMKPFAWGVEVIMEMDKLMVFALTKADVSKVKMQLLACVTETPITMDVSGTVWFNNFLEKEREKVLIKNNNRECYTVYTTLDLYEKYIKPNLVTSPDPKPSVGSGRKSKSTVPQSQTPGTNDKTNSKTTPTATTSKTKTKGTNYEKDTASSSTSKSKILDTSRGQYIISNKSKRNVVSAKSTDLLDFSERKEEPLREYLMNKNVPETNDKASESPTLNKCSNADSFGQKVKSLKKACAVISPERLSSLNQQEDLADINLRQVPKYTLKFPVPQNWHDMNGEIILSVNISRYRNDTERDEWETVKSKFENTFPTARVTSINRLQNIIVWEHYYLKKRELERRYGIGCTNEMSLFHGTTPDNIEVIVEQNLDPRMAGSRIGAVLGKGTYFAKEARKADSFAEPDAEGNKCIFLMKVLVGRFCAGKREYTRPPPQDTRDRKSPLYDSCVDNVNNPMVFCLFHDSQYYPQYIIKYQ